MPDISSQRDISGSLSALLRDAERAFSASEYRKAHECCLKALHIDPNCADAMFLLGMIAADHGNLKKAVEVIDRAIKLDATRAEYHAQRARCLVSLLQPADAMLSAKHALSLVPKDALTLDTIGVVMTRAGEHALAVEPFRKAVSVDATKPAYWYNLATASQFVGDFDEAGEAYRRALQLDPSFYRAWSSLAQLRRLPFEATTLAALDVSLTKELSTSDPDAALHIGHALAKHYEDAGEYAKSFEYLQRGKHHKCAAVRYSSDNDQKLFDAVRDVCTPGFLRDTASGNASEEPIFIVGMPRTGTTLVERILSSHPDVYAAGELSNFSLAIKRAAKTSSNLVLDVDTLQAARDLDWRSVSAAYVESSRPRTGHTKHFIDKMPLNFMYAGFISRALPNAKIICVRRNPIDTCLSNYRQLFATHFPYYNYSYDLLSTGRYYLMFDALIRYWRDHIPNNFYEIEYESVVIDTENQARRLSDFCGLNWNPACLDFHQNSAPVSTASSVQVRQPIYHSSLQRWRKYERETVELRHLLAH